MMIEAAEVIGMRSSIKNNKKLAEQRIKEGRRLLAILMFMFLVYKNDL